MGHLWEHFGQEFRKLGRQTDTHPWKEREGKQECRTDAFNSEMKRFLLLESNCAANKWMPAQVLFHLSGAGLKRCLNGLALGPWTCSTVQISKIECGPRWVLAQAHTASPMTPNTGSPPVILFRTLYTVKPSIERGQAFINHLLLPHRGCFQRQL